jgi:hypothetical protein
MWCGAEAALHAWMARPDVASAMHVVAAPHAFGYNIQVMDLSPLYTSLSQRTDLNFVIYNGQADANVPYNGRYNASELDHRAVLHIVVATWMVG